MCHQLRKRGFASEQLWAGGRDNTAHCQDDLPKACVDPVEE